MKCPFELPVKMASENHFAEGFYVTVKDKLGKTICLFVYPETTDYIVQAINSYEKFKTVLELVLNENFSGQSTISLYAKRQVKQALKENDNG